MNSMLTNINNVMYTFVLLILLAAGVLSVPLGMLDWAVFQVMWSGVRALLGV